MVKNSKIFDTNLPALKVGASEYTVNSLAKMSGVSKRTLRYYDELGLLKPARVRSNNYRIYGKEQVDRLQQILFYRELDVSLDEIKLILDSPNFDITSSLLNHLNALTQKRNRIDLLIENVNKTIRATKGDDIMSNKEKFEGFKQELIQENEAKYGEEIRNKYGDETVDASNAKMMNMTEEQYAAVEKLRVDYEAALKESFRQGDPASELAQKACDLHRQWLSFFWPNYTKEAHLGVTQMYTDDPRFTAYYDKITPGSAEFLRNAVKIYCS